MTAWRGTWSPQSWVALSILGAIVGTLAVVGADIVEAVLGEAYGDDVGEEVAGLVVLFSAWMVVAVGVNVTFPLAFVARRLRALPWIASRRPRRAGRRSPGSARSSSSSTASRCRWRCRPRSCSRASSSQLGALAPTVRGIAIAALGVAALTFVAFLPPGLVLEGIASALAGLVVYVALVLLVRPRGLRESWEYLRALR